MPLRRRFRANTSGGTGGKGFLGAAATIYPVTVTIGGVSANVLFAGIAEAGPLSDQRDRT